jgi:TatD family-associated radical SAM protein
VKRPALAYGFEDALYLNLTNRCPTACVFCIKSRWAWTYRGWDLRLPEPEPPAEDFAAAAVERLSRHPHRELVFCGYGEPTYRLPELVRVSRLVRRDFPELPLRLNTVGLGDLIWRADISEELARSVDAVSVSVNTADPAQWRRLHRPEARFLQEGFAAVLRFAARCAARGLATTLTAVDLPGVDALGVRDLAANLGLAFRLRPRLESEGFSAA